MTKKEDLLTMLEALRLAVCRKYSESDEMAQRVFPHERWAPPNFRDILTDAEARTAILKAIDGKRVDDLGDALLGAGVSHNFQCIGESIVAVAMSGRLAPVLVEAGHIIVHDGADGAVVCVPELHRNEDV